MSDLVYEKILLGFKFQVFHLLIVIIWLWVSYLALSEPHFRQLYHTIYIMKKQNPKVREHYFCILPQLSHPSVSGCWSLQ